MTELQPVTATKSNHSTTVSALKPIRYYGNLSCKRQQKVTMDIRLWEITVKQSALPQRDTLDSIQNT